MFRTAFALLAVVALIEAKYIGCFVDQHVRDLEAVMTFFTTSNTAQTCQEHCRSKAYKYAGLQYGYQCFCGDRIGKYGQVADGECNMDCPVEYMQTCGGRWRNSVYETDYLGCWKDSVTRSLPDMTEMGSEASVEKCIEICESKGYEFAGLQYHSQCFCGHHHVTYGEVDRLECNRSCSGNSEQMCGGLWRNSVYKTQACQRCPVA